MAKMNRCKSVNGTKLQGVVDVQSASIQKDFNRMKKWPSGDLLEFRKGKCQILGTERHNSMCQDRLGMLRKQLDGKRQGDPGDYIKLLDSDSLISCRPLFKQNLNRNLNRNLLLFYVL